jgi:transcriptional regulator with XRE-family HTH domain
MDYKQFGEFLSKRRKQLHVSRSFIAEKLGYSKQIVYSWEKGNLFPNLLSWEKLCEILQIDINGLLNYKPTNKITGYKFNEEKFISNIKKLRAKNDLTQLELANRIGVNHKTISGWENHTSLPSVDAFIKMAQVFDVKYSTLFYGEEVQYHDEEIVIKKKVLSKYVAIGSTLFAVVIASIGATIFATTIHNNSISNSDAANYNVQLDKNIITIHLGETFKLNATSTLSVSWKSLDENVAYVNEGVITPVSFGTTDIIAYLTDSPNIYATCLVNVKYAPTTPSSGIVNLDKDVLEFFYPSKKVTARFLFEDKKTSIYEKQYNVGDPFVYDFVEPVFGPYMGWNYRFLGWDLNGDGLVDELPSTIEEDLFLIAVYEKEATNAPNFVELRNGPFGSHYLYKCVNPSSTLIFPSYEYKESLTASELFVGEDTKDEYDSTSYPQVKRMIYMEGNVYCTPMNEYIFPNIEYLSIPKTMVEVRGPYPKKVTINGGYLHGDIQYDTFKGGITNKMLNIETIEKMNKVTYLYENAFSGCSELEYINIRHGSISAGIDTFNKTFDGCSNLKLFNVRADRNSFKVQLKPSSFSDTNINYFDMRLIYLKDNDTKLKTKTTNDYYVVTEKVDEELLNLLDSSLAYSIFVIDSDSFVKPEGHLNAAFYLYSETKNNDSWHFDSNGYPTFEY